MEDRGIDEIYIDLASAAAPSAPGTFVEEPRATRAEVRTIAVAIKDD